MVGSILILAAHPDDEVLGCGCTIAKLSAKGASVHVVFLGDGVYSRQGDKIEQQTELHTRRAAASIFHFTEQTPAGAKAALLAAGIPVRLNFVDVKKVCLSTSAPMLP